MKAEIRGKRKKERKIKQGRYKKKEGGLQGGRIKKALKKKKRVEK